MTDTESEAVASDLADELEGLAEKATKGEWANGFEDLDCVWSRQPSNDGNVVCLPPEIQMELSLERWPANAALIVALRNNLTEILSALRRVEPGSDQPRPSVSEDQGASRDHALTDSVALDGEHFGPWRVWFDPPPIGTRECDWHYQHEDAEPECPAWMHGHCASRDACFAEIIGTYEERLP